MKTIDQNPLFNAQLLVGVCLLMFLVIGVAQSDLRIKRGSIVSIEYTLQLADGSLVAGNVGQAPLIYEAGGHRVLPAIDEALMGLKAGDLRELVLGPEQGYGPIRKDLMVQVDLKSLPVDARKVGSVLVATNQEGLKQRVMVRDIKGDLATVDYNHPFAGQEIQFTIKVIDVK